MEGTVKSLLEDKRGNIVGVNFREKQTNYNMVSTTGGCTGVVFVAVVVVVVVGSIHAYYNIHS